MDSDRGVAFWAQGFEIQSPWGSVAPEKRVAADDQMSHPPYGMGFLDLLNGNCDGGLFQSTLPPDCNSSTALEFAGQFPGLNTECLIPGSHSSAEPDCPAGQLMRDLGGAVGLGYSGDIRGPQITGHGLRPGIGDPSGGWQQTTHTNLMAYAEAAAVGNKGSFFTPLLLSQIEGGCRMPFAPDGPSSMNGNAMVSSSPSSFDLNLMTQSFFTSEPARVENASEPVFNKRMPLQPQNLPQYDATRTGTFDQNIAGLPVELTPEEMAVLEESYASANAVEDDRYAQQIIRAARGNLMPQYPWTPATPARNMPLQTHMSPQFISMSSRGLMAQYPPTPARKEINRPLRAQTLTELINASDRDFMPQYPWTPTNLQANRPPPGTPMPPEIIDLVGDLPGGENSWEARQSKLCLLDPPPPPDSVSLGTATPFGSALVQQQPDTEGVVSSAEATDQATTAAAQGFLEDDDIDLNKAPAKKPKRKKHRPKVVREGKQAKTPRPATPKPTNASGKRKYVKKNKADVSPETLSAEIGRTAASGSNDGNRQDDSSRKLQRKRKNHPKDSPENLYGNSGGAAEMESRFRNNAVRRQLDFTDEVFGGAAYHISTPLFTNNAECQYQQVQHGSSTLNTNAAATVHQTKAVPGFPDGLHKLADREVNEHIRSLDSNFQSGRTESARTDHILYEFQTRVQQEVRNSLPGCSFSLHSSGIQEPNEHIGSTNEVFHPFRTDGVIIDRILDEFRIAENPSVPPQISKRENMKRLARKSSLSYTSNSNRCQELHSLKTSNMPGKRRISDIILDNYSQCFMNATSVQPTDRIKNLNQSQNAYHHDTMIHPEYNAATRSKLALVPYSHSFAISAPNIYEQYSTKSRMKEKARTFIPANKEVLQSQKTRSLLDDVIQKLRNLTLSENALVIYTPKKLRPKVDLDPETSRVWNLLMGKEADEDQETEVDKEKWWEKEREVFSGRVHSFIERMHLVQGDRRFSKWKGSVVDSVVGVFLTQNVSDNLSSTAFMELAARFPPKSRCKNFESSVEESESCTKHEDSSIETVEGNGKRQVQRSSDQLLHSSSPLVGEADNEVENSNESFGSNSSCTVANYTKVRCVDPKKKALETSHDSPDSESSTPITQTSINLTETEDRWSVEDAGSSQNSSENPLHAANQIKMSSPEFLKCISDRPFSQDFAAISGSAPFADFQQIFKYIMQPLASAEVEAYLGMDPAKASFPSRVIDSQGTDQNGEYISQHKLNENVFGIHRAVQSQLQNQNFDNEQNSAVSAVLFQSQPVGDVSDQPHSHFSERVNNHEKMRQPSEHTEFIFKQDEGIFGFHNAVQSLHQTQNADDQQNTESSHHTSPSEDSKSAQLDSKDDAYISNKATDKIPKTKAKGEKIKTNENDGNMSFEWDSLRKEVCPDGSTEERSHNTMDTVDWEAVRTADVREIARAIEARGMNNLLAARIKGFLNRLVDKHGSIDLEWLRKVEPSKAKDYLISIKGLGLKSAECVRLLTLHNMAFPVDTNVCRVSVRLGWVPLQPLPDTLPLHLLELYPDPGTVQKYLWPRLCKLDQLTLYELHYQLITFGKVFCTKGKPNCNACPMRGECKHFASAFASTTLRLRGPEEKSTGSSNVFSASQENRIQFFNPTQQIFQIEETNNLTGRYLDNCQPIIEEPASPEPESAQIEESDIEDAFYEEDPDEIPTIKLNIEEFTQNVQDYMQANNLKIKNIDTSSNLALVITKPEDASIPMPKLKNVSRLRTEHLVYEIPDSHPLLEGFEPRESDDPSPYLLAIWTAGETAQSTEPPKESCNSDETGVFCNKATCFTCSSRRESQAQIVRGTILMPCRTAMRGSFPLNGTYFQVNEVFADHDSSRNPIDVPREWIWNLRRRTVFFGTSVTSIFKGLTTAEIQYCFWRGFVCVRGFYRKTRAPKPLCQRLHFIASKAPKNMQQEKEGSSAKTPTNNTIGAGSIRS